MPGGSPIWKLFRLGLILWACITLLRHAFYWTNALSFGSYSVLGLVFAGVECVFLVMILLAAINSPRPTRERFLLLGGYSCAFISVVVVGACIDILANDPFSMATPSSFLRVVWLFIARVQIAVIPLLCVIGLVRGVDEQ